MGRKPQTLFKLISHQDERFNHLLLQAKALTEIKIIINQVIDYQIAEHTEVAKIHNGQLTLICDSAVWATRLRYMEPQIVKKLQQYSPLKAIHKIDIKIRPLTNHTSQQNIKPKRKVELSLKAANQILDEANAISDPGLKNALKKLARHAKS